MALWTVRNCMRKGEDKAMVDVRMKIHSVGDRHAWKKNPKKFNQKFLAVSHEYDGEIKTKEITLIGAPSESDCEDLVGQDVIASQVELEMKKNNYPNAEYPLYLASMKTFKMQTIEQYEAGGLSANPDNDYLEEEQEQKPSAKEEKKLTKKEKIKQTLDKCYEELIAMTDDEPLPEDRTDETDEDHEPDPVAVPLFTPEEVEVKRKKRETDPTMIGYCSKCGKAQCAKDLEVSVYGQFCESCDPVKF